MIPKNIIDEVRDRTDIVELIGARLSLKRAGANYRALCPFHKEKTPSFSINPQRQIYHCFGCGKGGNVFQFLIDYDGLDFISAVKLLAERANIEIEEEHGQSYQKDEKALLYKINEEAAHIFYRILNEKPEAEAARAYLQGRDIGEETISKFQLGYAPDRWDVFSTWGRKKKIPPASLEAAGLLVQKQQAPGNQYYDRFRDRIMIPIRDELGRVVGFSGRILQPSKKAAKYVNSPETLIFHKNRVLFGLDQARRSITEKKQAILCEGQIDAIRCHQAGFTNTVATQGTALSEYHARILKRYCDEVILVLDPDTAGQNAAIRSYQIFLSVELSVRIAVLPDNQDPDTLIQSQGADAFKEVLKNAIPGLSYQVSILKKREDMNHEAGAIRITKAVLGTI